MGIIFATLFYNWQNYLEPPTAALDILILASFWSTETFSSNVLLNTLSLLL